MCEISHHRCKPNYVFNALLKCKYLLAAGVAVTYCLDINNQVVFA